jgi:GT2 family glycosyltransferase
MHKNIRVTMHIAVRERATELALLLQSLRTQTFKDWDLVILDGNSQPIETNHFLMSMINRIKLEGHYVALFREILNLGVCNARNKLIELDYFDNDFICRLDDDVVLEPDYLEKLLKVINNGFDIASGVTPLLGNQIIKRNSKFIGAIINKKIINKAGEITYYGDDCGFQYIDERIIEAHEFRSNALMKKEVVKKIKYETNLSPTGFREEAFFSLRAIKEGFRIGVNTAAIAYHIQCPSGGVRSNDYAQRVNSDNEYFKKWTKKLIKKAGNFLNLER